MSWFGPVLQASKETIKSRDLRHRKREANKRWIAKMSLDKRRAWQRARIQKWRDKNRERYRQIAKDYYARKKAKEQWSGY
jgi:hypothetical protein